jgi:predicted ATP-dependent endonuclease of OLD family
MKGGTGLLLRPVSFQIRNFKSIKDSGVCTFSKDNVTVLAGQNESGKTAILTALRDFDLNIGDDPKTTDYQPDTDLNAVPKVTVTFEINADDLRKTLSNEFKNIPRAVFEQIKSTGLISVTRNLSEGNYELEPALLQGWAEAENSDPLNTEEPGNEQTLINLSIDTFCEFLRENWPAFVYFDTFQDKLPRTVDFPDLTENKSSTASARVPQPVLDFITLSEIDLELVKKLETNTKKLGNYLRQRNAQISGDFLDYWNQKVDDKQLVKLSVEDQRNSSGTLQLAFYVTDGMVNQYPEQRSRGFLWFLSFYLRLAAAQVRGVKEDTAPRMLLVDEPGTYLHARAQRDVLKVFDQKLAKRDQIFYSTHSNFLIPTEKLHRLRVALKTKEGTIAIDKLTHPLLRKPEANDTLSPILTALGMDVRDGLTLARENNLIVEGISDHSYLSAWIYIYQNEKMKVFNIFPAMGALDVPHIASLFIGWGLDFTVLLDHEPIGDAARKKLEEELGVNEDKIIQPKQASGIEDLLSPEDFKDLLKALDPSLKMESHDTPTKAIKKLGVNKVLLARRYAELAFSDKLKPTERTKNNISKLFDQILESSTIQVE